MTSSLKPSMQLIVGRTAAYAVTFCVPLVLVRVFDPAQFGQYKGLFLLFSTVYAIAQVGMAESLFYFVPQYPEQAGRLVTNSLLALAGSGLVSALVLGALRGPASRWLDNPGLAPIVPVLGLYLALALLSAPLEILLIGRGRTAIAAVVYGASELVKAASLVVPSLLFHDVRWLVGGAIGFALVRLVACVTLLRREFGGIPRPSAALFRLQLAYVAPFALYALFDVVKANWHQYAVAAHVDAATFALYTVGCIQIPVVDFVAGPVGNVMMVGMRSSLREGDRDGALGLWHSANVRIAVVVVPLVTFLLLTAREWIVLLFTERYLGSVPVFLVWVPMLLFAILQTDGVLRVFAATRTLLALLLVQIALIALATGPALQTYSLVGAAVVTVTAIGAGRLAALVRIRFLLGIPWRRLLPWSRLLGIAASAAAAALVTHELWPHLPQLLALRLVLAGAVFFLLYAAVQLLLLCAARPAPAGTLRSFVRPPCVESPES
jgi:O-antigen/teichoic acid export membrane protein